MNFGSLRKGSIVNGDSGNDPKTLPDWMDLERFRRGQQFFQRHVASMFLALHCLLTVGFAVKNLAQALAFTKNSNTASKVYLRYKMTVSLLISFWGIRKTFGTRTVSLTNRLRWFGGCTVAYGKRWSWKTEGKRMYHSTIWLLRSTFLWLPLWRIQLASA